MKIQEQHAALIKRLQREIDQLLTSHLERKGSMDVNRRKKILDALRIFLIPSDATDDSEDDSSDGKED